MTAAPGGGGGEGGDTTAAAAATGAGAVPLRNDCCLAELEAVARAGLGDVNEAENDGDVNCAIGDGDVNVGRGCGDMGGNVRIPPVLASAPAAAAATGDTQMCLTGGGGADADADAVGLPCRPRCSCARGKENETWSEPVANSAAMSAGDVANEVGVAAECDSDAEEQDGASDKEADSAGAGVANKVVGASGVAGTASGTAVSTESGGG